jgi:hypothetical protein
MLALLMTLILAATGGFSQAPSSVQPSHKVGDTLRYTVTFDGDPNFNSVTLYFSTSAAPEPDQAGLRQQFSISQTRRLAPGKFEVEGTIPPFVLSGSYVLSDIQPRIEPNGVKDYDATKFHQGFEVENPAKYKFPPLKDVAPE